MLAAGEQRREGSLRGRGLQKTRQNKAFLIINRFAEF